MLRIVELNQGTGNCRGKEQDGGGSLPHVLVYSQVSVRCQCEMLSYVE